MFISIELGNLFQNEGPLYESLFCPMVVSPKETLSLTFWTYFTLWSMFKDFFHVIRAYIIVIRKNCDIYALLYSLINKQSIYCFEIFFRDMIHFATFYAETNAFILHCLKFFKFYIKVRVQHGAYAIRNILRIPDVKKMFFR